MEEIKDKIPIHSREAWDKLYARLKAEDLVPAKEVKPKDKLVYYGLRMGFAGTSSAVRIKNLINHSFSRAAGVPGHK